MAGGATAVAMSQQSCLFSSSLSGKQLATQSPSAARVQVRAPSSSAPAFIRCAASSVAPAAGSSRKDEAAAVAGGSSRGVFNFAAGPATLPENVLKKAQEDLFNWRGSGMSIMEMSHRGKEFLSVIQAAEANLKTLLAIPDNYEVLFLQGGATTQFSAIPLNLAAPSDSTEYLVTGSWSDKAFKEAQKYCKPRLAWNGKPGKYTALPSDATEYQISPNAKYVHICANETIHGVEFKESHYPSVGSGQILVADMSSNFCSKPVDVSKFGLIYAGAQKNVGPSGVTIVIIRKDLIGKAQPATPVMLDYKTHADNKSLYNTPPCFAIYMCGLVFEDLLAQGGLAAVAERNEEKARLLYDTIDGSGGYFKCPVERSVRSLMNVPFTMATPELEAAFLKEAATLNLVQLKGHRSVGGIRASIYNAMPKAGVEKLVALMKSFQAKHSS